MNGMAETHKKSVNVPTFGPTQDEAKTLILLLLEHHGLLVHHAVTVEEMPSRAPVSTAHHPQHGHGRPARVEVHGAGGELVRPGQGDPDPTRPHPTTTTTSHPSSASSRRPVWLSNGMTAAPAARRQHLQKRNSRKRGGKKTPRTETHLPPLPAAAGSAARLAPPRGFRRCCAVEE